VRIRALFFASYAEALGRDGTALELPEGATVSDALAAVRALRGAERLPPSPMVAVNREYARLDTCLHDGDEVAFVPPVAGG
jgi:molybdopterin converting factor subunit 1